MHTEEKALPPVPEDPKRAAVEFAKAFPNFIQQTPSQKQSANKLDAESQENLNQLYAQMRMNRPRPATVVNLHPWPLRIDGPRLLKGITIPACSPNEAFAYHHIRAWRLDWHENENGSRVFNTINPIQLAAEFVREFSNRDTYGGGVLIYEGEMHPDKMQQVETYDGLGRPLTSAQNGIDYDPENNPIPSVIQIPVMADFRKLLEQTRERRNEFYFRRVQEADHDYKLPDGRGKRNITPVHRMMAEVLHAQGLIAVLPDWNLSTRLEQGMAEDNCPACGNPRRAEAFKCQTCAHILDPLKAYVNGAIEYGHASMDRMTIDEWVEADELKHEREKAREQALAKRQGATTEPEPTEKPKRGHKAADDKAKE